MANQWDLTKIYADEDAFLADVKGVRESLIPAFQKLEGKLASEAGLQEYISLSRKAEETLSKLGMFASMRSDLNKKDAAMAKDYALVMNVFNEFNAATSFADPELLSAGEAFIKGYFEKHPEDKDFDYAFVKLFRQKERVLPAESEKLVSDFAPLTDGGSELYSTLSVADYTPKKVTLSDGREVEVSTANWTSLVEKEAKQEDRRRIFECLYSYYDEHKNTYGEIYNQVLRAELATMKARSYPSILASHLEGNKIPESVFLTLIDVASHENASLKRYYEIKRKYLGLEKFRSYDRFVQLAQSEKKFSYEEAKDLFYRSIERFPADFQAKAHEVTKEGYVDVFSQPGKRTGAYSTGGDGIHPYILLNFQGTLDDAFTIAHESGHSIHTLYSMEHQPLVKQGYTIFVAEIASTFDEHNLLDYLMASGKLDKQDKIFLLQKAIDEIVSTFYRQTLFAQYEYEISLLAEKGEPINYEVLSAKMRELYQIYYGIDIAEEKVKPLVWAYIPHLFYTPFYVYQYATSFTASMLIYQNVKSGLPHAFENYVKMLSSGGSMDPLDEVKLAGVDLTKRESFLSVTKRMDELVDELATLLGE